MRQTTLPHKIVFLTCVLALTALSIIMLSSDSFAFSTVRVDAQSQYGAQSSSTDSLKLLSDPFLQAPMPTSVQVVWFTEFEGDRHVVEYGSDLSEPMTAVAMTTRLSRTREDSDSQVPGRTYTELTKRSVWRHEATVTGLVPGYRVGYRVVSWAGEDKWVRSDRFTLSAAPAFGQPLTILLTSDHQLKPLTPANLQKVEELLAQEGKGPLDAVFFAGDLVNVPDRASEWFDDAGGLAFFPGLQGRAIYDLEKEGVATQYRGGQMIQHAPLFPIIGNHEVMGRYSKSDGLKAQYANTLPRRLVDKFYSMPEGRASGSSWVADHSYNTQTYEEIFSLPKARLVDGSQTSTYYATTFGDIRLVALYVTQIWRSPALTPETKGRYRERAEDIDSPEKWGYGQHIFEDIRKGSAQYRWLEQELASDAFRQAKYKIVMLHHPPHTLGGNIVPAFTDPIAVENRLADGSLQSVQYEYPLDADYITRDLMPLLERAEVQLVFYGHSHLWNRFVSPSGMHFLETSNVGNSYGAHIGQVSNTSPRAVPTDEEVARAGDLVPFEEKYLATGDPNGLNPVVPTLAPLTDEDGYALPYIASNDITSFSLLEISGGENSTGVVSSYYFDTRYPDSAVVKFDEFVLGR